VTTPIESTQEPDLRKKLAIKVCGVGGAGCNVLHFMSQANFEDMELFALNTDARALAALPLPNKIVLGRKRTRGLGAGADPEIGRLAAEDEAADLASICKGADILFLLAGMGGGTGTGASPVLARIARESGALVLAIVTLPFEFEGLPRHRQAAAGLQQLKAAADAVICLPNQKLQQLLDENTTIVEAFAISNGLLTEGLRGIVRMLEHTGLINIDFADLCAVTRSRHSSSSFATAQATGEKRTEQLIEKLLTHPLLDGGEVLSQSDALLVSVIGGPDLTMQEVNRLMGALNRRCENARVMFGAAIDDACAGQLAVTLVASHLPAVESEAPGRRPTPIETFVDRLGNPPGTPSDLKNEPDRPPSPRKKPNRLQKELPLEVVFKGRFEKSEPTIRRGQDLDVPTYVRRGVALN
jgi:cell division protein FtsZ